MISDVVAVSAITVVGGIVTLVIKHYLDKFDKTIQVFGGKQEEVHKQIDGKMEKLLEVTGAKERAEGINEGIAQKQEEVDKLRNDSEPKK